MEIERKAICMTECKQCGSAQVVKSGTVRGKQRYLCKRCGCHFVEGDQRERTSAVVPKALCAIFQALGVRRYRTIGKYLNRDTSLIHRWMSGQSMECKRRWKGDAQEIEDVNRLFDKIKHGGAANGSPMLMADNVIDDLYIALIVQKREKQ